MDSRPLRRAFALAPILRGSQMNEEFAIAFGAVNG